MSDDSNNDDIEALKRALDGVPVTREERARSRKLFWEAMNSLTFDLKNIRNWKKAKDDTEDPEVR